MRYKVLNAVIGSTGPSEVHRNFEQFCERTFQMKVSAFGSVWRHDTACIFEQLKAFELGEESFYMTQNGARKLGGGWKPNPEAL